MPLSMHQASVPVFTQGLTGLRIVLGKAAAHAEARKIDPAALLTDRLFPDMFPLTRQVVAATEFARGCTARLAGQEPAPYEGDDTSFDGLTARVDAALAYVATFDAAAIDGSEERDVTVQRRDGPIVMKGQAYLMAQSLPHFFFHVTTAYGILRSNGVEVGKRDYLGMA